MRKARLKQGTENQSNWSYVRGFTLPAVLLSIFVGCDPGGPGDRSTNATSLSEAQGSVDRSQVDREGPDPDASGRREVRRERGVRTAGKTSAEPDQAARDAPGDPDLAEDVPESGQPDADGEAAVIGLLTKANAGDARAQWQLGDRYSGLGSPDTPTADTTDDDEAIKWYRRSAASGSATGTVRLGLMHALGRGVPQDEQKSIQFYRAAAENGSEEAAYSLGMKSVEGQGVTQSDAKAVEWFRKAAERGHVDAQYRLGDMLYAGRGVTQDAAEAMKWMTRAAEQGLPSAEYRVGVAHRDGVGVPRDRLAAIKWLKRAAGQDDSDAQVALGIIYRERSGFFSTDGEAVKWFQEASANGNPSGQFLLGVMYTQGRGVEQDDAEAAEWFRKSAEQGHAGAQLGLGLLYDQGRGVPQDFEEAVRWFRKAADQGQPDALFHIGNCYFEGNGVSKDVAEAAKCFRAAAEGGVALARYNLGTMHHQGIGVKQDEKEAAKWLRLAARAEGLDTQVNASIGRQLWEIASGHRSDEEAFAMMDEGVACLRAAASEDHPAALSVLSRIFITADDSYITNHRQRFLVWHQNRASDGDPFSMFFLVYVYSLPDTDDKSDWVSKAVAIENLARFRRFIAENPLSGVCNEIIFWARHQRNEIQKVLIEQERVDRFNGTYQYNPFNDMWLREYDIAEGLVIRTRKAAQTMPMDTRE